MLYIYLYIYNIYDKPFISIQLGYVPSVRICYFSKTNVLYITIFVVYYDDY